MSSAPRIEHHTIYPIPADERHGRAVDLFTVWFGSNIMILTIATGAIATLKFQLSLAAASVALIAGNLLGGVFMALHAAQGPQLGVPQMVQSRGQFGSRGAIFVVALVVFMYLGFVASNLVLGGQSLHSIVGPVSDQTGIVLIALLSVAAAVYGYDLIHAYARWMSWVCGAALAVCFLWIIGVKGVPADLWQRGTRSVSGFRGYGLGERAVADRLCALRVGLFALLARRERRAAGILGQLFGLRLGIGVAHAVGRATGNYRYGRQHRHRAGDGLGAVQRHHRVDFFHWHRCHDRHEYLLRSAFNHHRGPDFQVKLAGRPHGTLVLSIIFSLLAVTMALLGATNFMVNYENFLTLLLCVMAPWTAVNLVDFYWVKHGAYDVSVVFCRRRRHLWALQRGGSRLLCARHPGSRAFSRDGFLCRAGGARARRRSMCPGWWRSSFRGAFTWLWAERDHRARRYPGFSTDHIKAF